MNAQTALVTATLTAFDASDLDSLEGRIRRGIDTFVEVGEALAEIRDRKLYRAAHATFDDYLEERWQTSRARACRLIQSAETIKLLPTGNKPTSERQVRALSKLPPERRAEAWCESVLKSPTGTPTFKEVEAIVASKVSKSPIKPAGEAPSASMMPLSGMSWLQTTTFAFQQLESSDRKLFDNFRAGWVGQ